MRDDIRLVGRKGRHVEPRYVEYIRRLRPVLFYDFCNQPTKYDTGTRDLVYDLSGNGNHGVIKRVYGVSITNEKFTSAFDTPVQLDHRFIYTTPAPVVTNPTGDITYTEGTDYTINYTAGQITVLSGGTIPDATACYIDYTYDDTGASWRYECLDFDGVDDYIEVPHNDRLNLPNGLTVMLWLRFSSTLDVDPNNNYRVIIGKPGILYEYHFVVEETMQANPGIWSDGMRYQFRSYFANQYYFSVGKWTFYSFSYDANTKRARFWVNGALGDEAEIPTASLVDTSNSNLRICLPGFSHNGQISMVVIFNKQLRDHEMRTIYQLTRWRHTD